MVLFKFFWPHPSQNYILPRKPEPLSQQMNRQYLPLLLVHAPLLSSDPQFEKYWLRRVGKVALVLDSYFLYVSF